MTETPNFKLKKPDLTDPVDVSVFNDNLDIIDDEMAKGGVPYVIDATSIKVDFDETFTRTYALTDIVDVDALLAAHEAGREIQLKMGVYGNDEVEFTAKLDDHNDVGGAGSFSGFVAWHTESYSIFKLTISSIDNSVALLATPNPMGAVVKTVNGVGPDEDGNVEVETAEETPISLDLSGYEAGTIVLGYADGGSMNIAVTFDANGNPISFSNGTEVFTVTWPAEEVNG